MTGRPPVRRVALAIPIVAGLALGGSPNRASAQTAQSAQSGSDQVAVADTADAWYSSPPALNCSSVVGCPPVPVPQTYAAGTLQVGEFEGSETARTYVALGFGSLPPGTIPVDGVLVLPISGATNSGNLNEAAAQPEVCLAAAPFPNGTSGSTSAPPAIDCSVHMATTYHAASGSAPAGFTADLAPALTAWGSGRPDQGLAIVPAPGQASTSEWQVAFNGRSSSGVPPVSATVTVVPGTPVPAAPTPPSAAHPGPAAVPGEPVTPLALAPAAGPALQATPLLNTGTGIRTSIVAPPAVAATPTTSLPPSSGSPYQVAATIGSGRLPIPWPILWFPLLLLAGAAFTLRAFLNPVITERRDQ